MEQYYELLKTKLKENDLRLTNQRKMVLEALFDNRDAHLNVEELYKHINKEHPEVGLATVYRTLDMFVNLGIVHKMEFGDKGALYELRVENGEHYHHHLFCVDCGKIIDFSNDGLDELEEKIMQKHGFLIKDHTLRFYGLCKQCQMEDSQEEINS